VRRLAIIIDAGQAKASSALSGTKIDTDAWAKYLQSPRGGAWYTSEVNVLTNPSKFAVEARIKTANIDYCLVAFSGHGYVDGASRLTYGVLKDGDMSEVSLTPPCDRSIVVMDSCREVEYGRLTEGKAVFAAARIDEDVSAHREAFDAELAKHKLAKYRLFGCDFQQVANEDSRGGFFTSALINAGSSLPNGVLSIKAAFDIASAAVQARERTQRPDIQCPRTLTHLPFAVSVTRPRARL
jgi:hypothetical protein